MANMITQKEREEIVELLSAALEAAADHNDQARCRFLDNLLSKLEDGKAAL